jgi:hypothetical protein
MDEYNKLLILAYFKEFHENYSLQEIKKYLGVTNGYFDNLISQLIDDEFLVYKDYLITLSLKGRTYLINKNMEWYSFDENLIDNVDGDKWPLDKPYVPKKFSKKYN